ncbi:ABC transporter ATP-binding protein [Cyanobacterium aponinum AL20118]|uniref:ABC transporter ATP-binding protein n=1 Tax=Cyanobacterium aponinum AL20115 TaxID=3090662 RepID=A0AAF0ZB62_9CHRO|nr:ABC transporter ATP-binding protein [Cyanobacterium aponinum]WPF89001.1 ABC transporter ATP-binding protein [Cyanobacterium aponinum AL20115]
MTSAKSLTKTLPILSELLSYFSPYLHQQKWLVIITFIAIVAEVGLRVLEPLPLKFIFDYVLGDTHTTPLILNQISPLSLLTLSSLSILLITSLRAFAGYWSTIASAIVSSRVMTQVRDDLYCHLQQLSLNYHNQSRSGDLIIRVSSDASRLQEILLTATLPLIISSLTLVATLGAMLWIDVKLTLLSLLTVPLFVLAGNLLSSKIQESSLNQRKKEGLVASTAAESMMAIKLIQSLSLENAFAQIFSHQNQASLTKKVETQRLSASLERIVDMIIALGIALVLWYGSYLVLQDNLTAGDVIVFFTYLKNAFKPIQNFAKYTGRLAKASASGERILNIFKETPEIRDLPHTINASPLQREITFKNLSFTYPSGKQTLNNINLTIKAGQFVMITGISGGGKSTLMSLLLRLYEPTSGAILVDGEDIRNYTLKSWRSQISVVLQESLLFGATIRENIAYGVKNVTDKEIVEATKLANIHDFISNLPHGYDTMVGERGTTLSGGQRQRIAIARAAIRQTPILILDEPTTGLDRHNEEIVMESLQKLAQNRTTFLITHDLSLAEKADLILYLNNGKIEILSNCEHLNKLVKL